MSSKPFTFTVPKKAAKIETPSISVRDRIEVVSSVNLPTLIQGQEPGSSIELYVAWALNQLQVDYYYQYVVEHGRARRGGQVIDFMVLTRPLWTPVYVQGSYWHRGARENADKLKQQELMVIMRGRIKPVVELWEEDLPTPEAALEAVRKKVL